jgi:meiosis induction protein kinase IME2/SME1
MQRSAAQAMVPLEERFEVIKEIGDGSFGSVALARVRGAGASVARRGTMVSRARSLDVCNLF